MPKVSRQSFWYRYLLRDYVVGLLRQVPIMFGSRGLFKSDRTSYCTTVRCMSRRRHQHVVFDPKFLCPGSNDFSAYILSCYHLDCFLLPLHLVIGKCNMTRTYT
jgi:hypothetical protein